MKSDTSQTITKAARLKWPEDPIDRLILVVWKISIPMLTTVCVVTYLLEYINVITISRYSILYHLSGLGYMAILFFCFIGSIVSLAGIAFLFVMWVEGHEDDDEMND